MTYAWGWIPNISGYLDEHLERDVDTSGIIEEPCGFLPVDGNGLHCTRLPISSDTEIPDEISKDWKRIVDQACRYNFISCSATEDLVVAASLDDALRRIAGLFIQRIVALIRVLSYTDARIVSSSDIGWPDHLEAIHNMRGIIGANIRCFEIFMDYYGQELGERSLYYRRMVCRAADEAYSAYENRMFAVRTEYEHSTLKTNRLSLYTAIVAMSITAFTAMIGLALSLL